MTGATVIPDTAGTTQPSMLQPRRLSQKILSTALRRMGLPGSGTEAVLAGRLEQAGVSDVNVIADLAREWDEHRIADPTISRSAMRAVVSRQRGPNWTRHETARNSMQGQLIVAIDSFFSTSLQFQQKANRYA